LIFSCVHLPSISSTFYVRVFCTKVLSYFCQSQKVTREKLDEALSNEKCARKMLVKLTPAPKNFLTWKLVISDSTIIISFILPRLCLFLWMLVLVNQCKFFKMRNREVNIVDATKYVAKKLPLRSKMIWLNVTFLNSINSRDRFHQHLTCSF